MATDKATIVYPTQVFEVNGVTYLDGSGKELKQVNLMVPGQSVRDEHGSPIRDSNVGWRKRGEACLSLPGLYRGLEYDVDDANKAPEKGAFVGSLISDVCDDYLWLGSIEYGSKRDVMIHTTGEHVEFKMPRYGGWNALTEVVNSDIGRDAVRVLLGTNTPENSPEVLRKAFGNIPYLWTPSKEATGESAVFASILVAGGRFDLDCDSCDFVKYGRARGGKISTGNQGQ